MRLPDGFPGERLRVLPTAVARAASAAGPTSRLLVTDAGFFPRALHHGRQRDAGASGTILIVCAAGRGWCRTEAGLVRVRAAQALVVPHRLGHMYGADDADPWTIWWLHATGPDAVAFEQALGAPSAGQVSSAVQQAPLPALVELHDTVALISAMERALHYLETDETTPSLLRAAGAAWWAMAQVTADATAGSPMRAEPVRAAQDHLRAHLDQPVQVADLARAAGLSASHFAALFRAATGAGVMEYAKRLRMARACELLITTSLTVTEVAQLVGYGDPFYFSRQFRSVHACSPSAFRDRDH